MKTKDEVLPEILIDFIERCKGTVEWPENLCTEPYGSPWEREFEWVLSKYLPRGVRLRNQVELCGRYRVDFVFEIVKTGNLHVIEFDGKAFHNREHDLFRDNEIFFKEPRVKTITRVDASTGNDFTDSVRAFLMRLIPHCFSDIYEDYLDIDWVRSGDTYTGRTFDERECNDRWWDYERMEYRDGAPMRVLKIIHRVSPTRKQ